MYFWVFLLYNVGGMVGFSMSLIIPLWVRGKTGTEKVEISYFSQLYDQYMLVFLSLCILFTVSYAVPAWTDNLVDRLTLYFSVAATEEACGIFHLPYGTSSSESHFFLQSIIHLWRAQIQEDRSPPASVYFILKVLPKHCPMRQTIKIKNSQREIGD